MDFQSEDISRFIEWLGHGNEYTELCAWHKDYRSGIENLEDNKKYHRFPKIWYVKRPDQAIAFVRKFHRYHTCNAGINPRSNIFRNSNGYVRCATDDDIEVLMNMYIDIDFLENPTSEQIADLEFNLVRWCEYFIDLKLNRPIIANSGNGCHLWFALEPIQVNEHPDVKEQSIKFKEDFKHELSKEFADLGVKVDNTQDLSRLAKLPGSKKPYSNRMSMFPNEKRLKDARLTEYLLNLNIEPQEVGSSTITIPKSLPERFEKLLKHDGKIRQLWDGTGKLQGDTTSSGYDFALIKQCLTKGITDINDLSAILAIRRKNDLQHGDKSMQYIKRTIGNAIFK